MKEAQGKIPKTTLESSIQEFFFKFLCFPGTTDLFRTPPQGDLLYTHTFFSAKEPPQRSPRESSGN